MAQIKGKTKNKVLRKKHKKKQKRTDRASVSTGSAAELRSAAVLHIEHCCFPYECEGRRRCQAGQSVHDCDINDLHHHRLPEPISRGTLYGFPVLYVSAFSRRHTARKPTPAKNARQKALGGDDAFCATHQT